MFDWLSSGRVPDVVPRRRYSGYDPSATVTLQTQRQLLLMSPTEASLPRLSPRQALSSHRRPWLILHGVPDGYRLWERVAAIVQVWFVLSACRQSEAAVDEASAYTRFSAPARLHTCAVFLNPHAAAHVVSMEARHL